MGVTATFQLGGENVQVIVDGNNVMFSDSSGMITTVEGLRPDHNGVIKEFPDLKDDSEWRKKAFDRLKAKLKSMDKEMDKINYVKDELTKFGYIALFYQRWGYRPKKFN